MSQSLRRQCDDHWAQRGLTTSPHWSVFSSRLDLEFEPLIDLLAPLYGSRLDFALQVESLVAAAFDAYAERSEALRQRDEAQGVATQWFRQSGQVGAVGYVDRFAQDFRGIEARIPYLKELGVTYLHLMPFFESPQDENDGGYAVSSYRRTDPRLGTMDDLEALARSLDENGIALVADFVFNHTSDEHPWAAAALSGDSRYQDYYWMFESEQDTRVWQAGLRDIFPEVRRGSFTWNSRLSRWIWTTFHSYQWDLNYSNPEVFTAMARELLSLANRGVSVLRLDAVAFVWKEAGTTCENRPGAHLVIQAFQAVTRLVCPSLVFKSEAIVHPDEIARYMSPRECQLSYNPLLMAELWEAAATKQTALLALSLRRRHAIPEGTCWVNYVRCHDDIGWNFADEDAAELGINGYDHRQFLNRFYTGDFPGTFARGVGFQHNPETGDRRICGSASSLAGLERARIESSDPSTPLNRLKLLYTLIYSVGGIPLLYLGDEVAVENNYAYRSDPSQAADSRWVHRPVWSDELARQRHNVQTNAGQMFSTLVRLARLRQQHALIGSMALEVLETDQPSVLAFLKADESQRLVVLGNFSEQAVSLDQVTLRRWTQSGQVRSLTTESVVSLDQDLVLEPCAVRLLLSDLSKP